jgi:hypothetical protein
MVCEKKGVKQQKPEGSREAAGSILEKGGEEPDGRAP